MKLYQIINALPLLQKIFDEEVDYQTRYERQKLINSLQPEIDIYNTGRFKIFEKYSKAAENGKLNILPENFFNAENESRELGDVEVNAVFEKIKIYITKDDKMSANYINILEPFVDFILKDKQEESGVSNGDNGTAG